MRFYFGSMPTGGTANVFIELFVRRNQKIKFVEPCRLDVEQVGNEYYPLCVNRAPYVAAIEDPLQTGFRSVDWKQHLLLLTHMLDKYNPLSMWFSSFNESTVDYIKQQFQQNVTTIAFNYTNNDYDFLMHKWAKWQAGMIFRNPKFQELKSKFSTVVQARDYCLQTGSEQFGYTIPKHKVVPADFMINLTDLYDQAKISAILDQLGFSCTEEDWAWYKHYVEHSG